MGNEIVQDCKYYQRTAIALEDIEELKKGHTLLEASMKSVHKRMDEDNKIRIETHDSVVSLSQDMKSYKTEETNRRNFLLSIFSFIFVIAMAVSGWVFITINENEDRSKANDQALKSMSKSVDKIDANVENIKEILYSINKE